jgi:hypothetical protein
MELRDIDRPATIGELIDDPRYGFKLTSQSERWETRERIKHQRAERRGEERHDG